MMRGASADALAGLGDLLKKVGASDEAAVGTDLFGVAGMLRGEAGLRRVATDASIDSSAKSGLVSSLLQGKVGQAALDLVANAVGRRWTATRDLADALEHLGVVSVVRSAGDKKRLADELFEVRSMIDDSRDLRSALSDPARSTSDKQALLSGLLDGKVLAATMTLVHQALAGTHRTIGTAIESYQSIAADVYDESVATVRTAKPLSDHDITRLTAALSAHYGTDVHLNVVVDPDLVGGLRVDIGDDVIDGSVSSRLDDARRKLAG